MSDVKTETVRLVYCGQRRGSDKKTRNVWCEVTEAMYDEGAPPPLDLGADCYRVYEGKGAKRHLMGGVGATYDVPQEVGTTVLYPAEARYVGHYPNDALRELWRVEDRAARTLVDMNRQRDKQTKADQENELSTWREQYRRARSHDRRAAILAQAIAYITRE